ncbi:MAG: hypothetical protein GXP15_02355 [Gammaproteobacteria bacterium]|nr:hypothetical protein [Gammaproteobacteria bacterium]
MSLPENIKVALSILILSSVFSAVASADGIVVGLGAEGDTVDGRAYSFFVDVGLRENTWISGAVAVNETKNAVVDLNTKFADLSVDHFFDPIGIRLGGGYWGDKDLLESNDVHASLYLRGKKGSISADFEGRNFDLTLRRDVLAGSRSIDFSAKGYGLTGRLKTSDRTSVYLGGMNYDYSRRIGLQPETDRLRFLAISRISLMNSLIDYRLSGGVEIEFGERRLDFRYSHWKTAVFRGQVDSLGVGWLTPVGNSADVEFRLAVDNSDEFGRATVFSIFLYFYAE